MMNARLLEKKLQDFGVEGEVVEVKPGPVVTMYEFAPAPGVKVSKIAGLSDDLSMALRPSRSASSRRSPAAAWSASRSPTATARSSTSRRSSPPTSSRRAAARCRWPWARTSSATPWSPIWPSMPHLLVAGSTGTGKSVSINTMILSLLYRADPRDVRMIMIDPKMLELSMYEGIPHLLLPVVTSPKKAALALNWAVREMERRYQLMADKGVRNIEGYNRKLAKEAKDAEEAARRGRAVRRRPGRGSMLPEIETVEEETLEHGHLPYIVVIVDELADLMMVAGREVEESIARLAQMARAAGIHLILATQRPSRRRHHRPDQGQPADPHLLPGLLAHRLAHHPRLDGRRNPARQRRHALHAPGSGVLQRVHGAFVSEIEVQRVVDFLKKQGKPDYDKSILDAPAGERRQQRTRTKKATTRSGTRRWRSSPRPGRPRSPCCSAGCASATTAPRG